MKKILGKYVKVTITGDDENYDDAPVVSKKIGPITLHKALKLKVKIEEEGTNLKAVGVPVVSLPPAVIPSYQWYQYDTQPTAGSDPEASKAIKDAASATSAKASLDASKGKYITVVVLPPKGNKDYESSGLAEAYTLNSASTQCSVVGCKTCIENKNAKNAIQILDLFYKEQLAFSIHKMDLIQIQSMI
ncbi:hypothetical protein M9Y10_025713 [Tritrichomonas musculus]|uniref:Uncharacterized protein n=1 Tax=Tritrichomonas musculus TaxID=1915356 RepID=A0ABR2HAS2_9EUKA